MNENQYDLRADPRLDQLIKAFKCHPELGDGGMPKAIGVVVLLLRWAAQNAPSGDLSPFAPQVLADAIDWEGDPDLMIQLLREAGFLSPSMKFIDYSRMLQGAKNFLKWAFEETDNDYK